MSLDRLLLNANLRVAPFAVCDIRRGARLDIAGKHDISMHFVLHGTGDLIVGGERTRVDRYTLILVPPDVAHAVSSSRDEAPSTGELTTNGVDGVERIVAGAGAQGLLMACGALEVELSAAGLFDRLEEPLIEPFSDTSRMQQLFDALLEEQLEQRPGGRRIVESIMMQCLVHLLRRVAVGASLPWLQALNDPQLRRALDAIFDAPGAAHSADKLAATAGMSRSSFSARFSGAFGTSPMAFVKAVRLQRASKLLRTTDLPIKVIADRVGYASRSHFSRAFKQQFRKDPARFRHPDHQDDGREE